jgi:hypothetical protein
MPGTHGPVDPVVSDLMNEIARTLDRLFEKRVHWALLVFPKGSARANYISNAERSSMLAALKELVARFEGTHPEERVNHPGTGEVQ